MTWKAMKENIYCKYNIGHQEKFQQMRSQAHLWQSLKLKGNSVELFILTTINDCLSWLLVGSIKYILYLLYYWKQKSSFKYKFEKNKDHL